MKDSNGRLKNAYCNDYSASNKWVTRNTKITETREPWIDEFELESIIMFDFKLSRGTHGAINATDLQYILQQCTRKGGAESPRKRSRNDSNSAPSQSDSDSVSHSRDEGSDADSDVCNVICHCFFTCVHSSPSKAGE